MVAVAGANEKVFGITSVTGKHRMTASDVPVYGGYIAVEFTGTYASGDDSTFNAASAIASSRNNGLTATIRDAAWAAPGDEAGANLGADTVATDGTNVTSQLLQDDLSTERADGLMGTFNEPIVYYCTWTEA